MTLTQVGILVGILVGIVGQVRGWWESPGTRARREREQIVAEQNRKIHDAILGQPEETDVSGAVIQPARPGLVALQRADSARLAKVEEAVVAMNHLTGLFTEAMKRMDVHEGRLSEHDHAIAALIATTYERGAKTVLEAERLKSKDVVDETD